MERPNIVYIHSHDTGRYAQPYGHPVAMSNYQRIADEGILFRQAYSAAPTCSPSRAALLTGQSPHASGMMGLAHRGFRLQDPGQHLARVLRDAGYHTLLAGVQHLIRTVDVGLLGYQDVIGKGSDAELSAAAFLDTRPTHPFFLDVGFAETHREGRHFHPDGPQGGEGEYLRPPAPLPDVPEIRAEIASYWDAARTLDAKVGVVLNALDRNGLAENTLVLCTTDHGIAFPRMKCNLTDHGIGVLLMLRWPHRFAGGRVTDALVSHIDLFPTLCEVAQVDSPDWLAGKSLMPLLTGSTDEVNEAVFAEVTYHAAYEPMRAVRTSRFKYIRRFEPRESPVLPNCDDSASKDYLLARGWRSLPPATEQLYDIVFDPNEASNLVGNPRYEEILNEMRGRLERWMTETNDPLLNGPVLPFPGLQYNDVDGLSPNEPVLVASGDLR